LRPFAHLAGSVSSGTLLTFAAHAHRKKLGRSPMSARFLRLPHLVRARSECPLPADTALVLQNCDQSQCIHLDLISQVK